MNTRSLATAVIGLLVALVVPVRPSAQQAGAPVDIPIGLTWRNIGPGGTGTRIVDFAVVERTPQILYAATASSGVWKTVNAGTTWEPLFQHEQTIALGGIAVSQSHPDIVWVATGEPNMRNLRSSSWGSGIYKSTDAGQTWRQMGLADAQHMGRVVIHPTNPDVVFATVIDHGRTWTRMESNLPAGSPVLSLVEDPVNPRLLFAGTQFGIYATVDGGARWFSLRMNLPTNAVHDMVIHPREGDLVIGTHGRGMWVLDSLAGLRGLTPETLATAGAIFTPRPAIQLTRFDRGRNAYGSAYFTAPNPTDGVYLDVYLNPSGTEVPSIEIADATGRVVRRLTARGAGYLRSASDHRRRHHPRPGGDSP